MPTGFSAPGPLSLEIASILRAELARQKTSKTDLAKATITISRAQVSKILNGLKAIDIEDLDRICFALGMDMVQVLRGADEATPLRHADQAG